MQLSNASKRKHIHTRRIECLGYERDDGLWDIEGPEGKFQKYDKYKPTTDEKIPKSILIRIELTNVFVINFAAAAGIINILKTKIIPTVCNEPTIAIDNKIKNK